MLYIILRNRDKPLSNRRDLYPEGPLPRFLLCAGVPHALNEHSCSVGNSSVNNCHCRFTLKWGDFLQGYPRHPIKLGKPPFLFYILFVICTCTHTRAHMHGVWPHWLIPPFLTPSLHTVDLGEPLTSRSSGWLQLEFGDLGLYLNLTEGILGLPLPAVTTLWCRKCGYNFQLSKQGRKVQGGLAQAVFLSMAFVVQKANGFMKKKFRSCQIVKYFFILKAFAHRTIFLHRYDRRFFSGHSPLCPLSLCLLFLVWVAAAVWSAHWLWCVSCFSQRWKRLCNSKQMGLGVQPCNYTFSLWPSNCQPSILTLKAWDHWGSGYTLAIRQVWPSPTCVQGLWTCAAHTAGPSRVTKNTAAQGSRVAVSSPS